jgi:hypothetical protein
MVSKTSDTDYIIFFEYFSSFLVNFHHFGSIWKIFVLFGKILRIGAVNTLEWVDEEVKNGDFGIMIKKWTF